MAYGIPSHHTQSLQWRFETAWQAALCSDAHCYPSISSSLSSRQWESYAKSKRYSCA